MRHSEQIDQIIPALIKAQGMVAAVPKSATNPHFKSFYMPLDEVMEAVKPVATACDLAIQFSTVGGSRDGFEVVTRLWHSSGQWVETGLWMPFEKIGPQGAGSAFTYGKRYGVAALFAIVADDDDDGNAASARPAPPPWVATAAKGKVMPFGRHKGEPLTTMSSTDLTTSIKWCLDADATKFRDLINDLKEELNGRIATDYSLPPIALTGGQQQDALSINRG